MDKIYDPQKYKNSGDLQHIHFLISSSQNFILPKTQFTSETHKEEIIKLMDMDIEEEDFETLESKCNPSQLKGEDFISVSDCSYQKLKYLSTPVTQEALKLKTVQCNEYNKNSYKTFGFLTYLKYRGENRIKTKETAPKNHRDLIPGENLVFKMRLYHPYKYSMGDRTAEPQFYHNLVLLGSQTLDVLRDKIICSSELSSCQDMSQDPNGQSVIPKDIFQSGFLFIDNTFYNDMRNPENDDYSKYIIDWAKSKKEFGPFKTASMADVTFNQLNVKLGFPYVYKHLGDCEHLFTFSDIEILQPSDHCSSSDYPMYTSCSLRKGKYCHMCGTYIAKWIVTECDRIPFEPAYFCETCFHSYNYINGKKVGNFKAFSYLDSVNAM